MVFSSYWEKSFLISAFYEAIIKRDRPNDSSFNLARVSAIYCKHDCIGKSYVSSLIKTR